MKTQNNLNLNISSIENQNLATEILTEDFQPISFQKKIDNILHKLKHSKRISNKERCRELMEKASFLIYDYNF